MRIAKNWKDFEVIATGNGEKLERWKDVVLLRPDPQVIWNAQKDLLKNGKPDAHYIRESTGGGHWDILNKMPDEWQVSWKDLSFLIKPMGFKHTGLFPEQAVNWEIMQNAIKDAKRDIKVLNLFAYTGGATVACAKAGAFVCHVDSAKNMVDRAKQNAKLSGVSDKNTRWIVDDCKKFVEREIRRGNKYDAIIMDPPSYGRGSNGEIWKLEDDLFAFVMLCIKLLSEKPLFVLINSYTTGLGATVLSNILGIAMKNKKGIIDSYEVCLETAEQNIVLPCGTSGLWMSK